jgi:hypothetical protein
MSHVFLFPLLIYNLPNRHILFFFADLRVFLHTSLIHVSSHSMLSAFSFFCMLIDYATGSSLVYLGEAMVSCTRHDGSEPVISSMSPGGNAVFSVFLYNIQV